MIPKLSLYPIGKRTISLNTATGQPMAEVLKQSHRPGLEIISALRQHIELESTTQTKPLLMSDLAMKSSQDYQTLTAPPALLLAIGDLGPTPQVRIISTVVTFVPAIQNAPRSGAKQIILSSQTLTAPPHRSSVSPKPPHHPQ